MPRTTRSGSIGGSEVVVESIDPISSQDSGNEEIVFEVDEEDVNQNLGQPVIRKKPKVAEHEIVEKKVERRSGRKAISDELLNTKMRREILSAKGDSRPKPEAHEKPESRVRDRDSHRDRDWDRRDRGRRDRSRDRDRFRDRRDRSRSRSRDRDRYRDRKDRSRSWSRERERRRDYDRDRDRPRDRDRDRRRSRSRERERDGARRRDRDRDRDGAPSPNTTMLDPNVPPTVQVSMRDVLNANSGMTMQDAISKMNVINSAIVRGQIPPTLAGAITMTAGAPPPPPPPPPPSHPPAQRVVPAPLLPFAQLQSKEHINHKVHRDIFVGNLPQEDTLSPQSLHQVVSAALLNLHSPQDGLDPVMGVRSNSSSSRFCFLEMRTIEDANTAVAYLNGLPYNNAILKVGRPSSWAPATLFTGSKHSAESIWRCSNGYVIPHNAVTSHMEEDTSLEVARALQEALGGRAPSPAVIVSSRDNQPQTPSASAGEAGAVILVSPVPAETTEAQCLSALSTFGAVTDTNIVALPGATTVSIVCRFETAKAAYFASQNASSLSSSLGVMPRGGAGAESSVVTVQIVPEAQAMVLLQKQGGKERVQMVSESSVIRLMNMVMEEDLADPESHKELVQEIEEECIKFGEIARLYVPKRVSANMSDDEQREAGVGVVFIAYKSVASAKMALKATVGRKFGGKRIEGGFYSDEAFAKELYSERAQERRSAAEAGAAAAAEREREVEREKEKEKKEMESDMKDVQEQEEEHGHEDAPPSIFDMGLGLGPGLMLAPPPPPVSLPYQATEEDEDEDMDED